MASIFESNLQIASKRNPKTYIFNDNPHKKNTGFKRLFFALINSLSGFVFAFKEESAFRQELLLSVLLFPSIFFFPTSPIEKILMIGSLLILLIVELLNSSVEAAIDRISFSQHDLSKRAKDLGSAAVFLSLLLVLITFTVIITKHLI